MREAVRRAIIANPEYRQVEAVLAAIRETQVLVPTNVYEQIVEAASWESADAHDLLLRVWRNQPGDLDEG
jgi:hypothetical protein